MAYKIVRALPIVMNQNHYGAHLFRALYEFFCYCIQGGASTTTPVGLAATTPSNLPANTLEGTSVLSTGTDGVTTLGSTTFTSASPSVAFSSSMIGKHLVLWKPSSGDTNDSIYPITAVANGNTLSFDFSRGGNPDITTGHPSIRARTAINYRIIDMTATGPVGTNSYTLGQYVVFQLTPQNAGQANSQIQFLLRVGAGQSGGMIMSPAGTWSGSAFTDALAEVDPTTNNNGWTNYTGTATVYVTMMGDVDGVLCFFRGAESNGGYFHFEAPVRLASSSGDPNPIMCATDGVSGIYTSSFGNSYNNHWMGGTDGVNRRHRLQVKTLCGDGQTNNTGIPNLIFNQNFTDGRFAQNAPRNDAPMSEILLGQLGSPSSQFTLARALLKYVRMCPNAFPIMTRFGSSGQWLHIVNGICAPWDNMVFGSTLFPNGF
jgi:hypothetical protein